MKTCFNADCGALLHPADVRCAHCKEPQPLASGSYSFWGATELSFRRWANYRGRASRSEYLRPLAIQWALLVLLSLTTATLGATSEQVDSFLGVVWLIFVLPNIAVYTRRLHDLDVSGKSALKNMLLVGLGGGLLGWFAADSGSEGWVAFAIMLGFGGVFYYGWMVTFRKGTDGPNTFGSPRFLSAAPLIPPAGVAQSPIVLQPGSVGPFAGAGQGNPQIQHASANSDTCSACGQAKGLLDRVCSRCGVSFVPEGW